MIKPDRTVLSDATIFLYDSKINITKATQKLRKTRHKWLIAILVLYMREAARLKRLAAHVLQIILNTIKYLERELHETRTYWL